MKNIKRTYHENGSLHEEYSVNNEGEKHGVYRCFYDNGQLTLEVSFTNDFQDSGTVISYHKNGNKYREVEVDRDLGRCGSYKQWRENGSLEVIGYYWDDKLNGIQKRFDENEVLIEEFKALDGRRYIEPESFKNYELPSNENTDDMEFQVYLEMQRTMFLDNDDQTFEALKLHLEFSDDGDGVYEWLEQIESELNYSDLIYVRNKDEDGNYKYRKVIGCPGIQDTHYIGDGGSYGPYSSIEEVISFLKTFKSVDFNDLDLSTDALDLFLS